MARRIRNAELDTPGLERLRQLDVVDQLAQISCPTLVSVGDVDPITPVTAAQEIVNALAPETAQLEVIDEAGHFPWLDHPDRYWSSITTFVGLAGPERPTPSPAANHTRRARTEGKERRGRSTRSGW